jgi:hypothetical protein
MIVAGLAVKEDLAYVIDRPLYLVDMPGLLSLHIHEEARTEGLEMIALRSSSTFCVSSIQRKELDIFNNMYRGSQCSPS